MSTTSRESARTLANDVLAVIAEAEAAEAAVATKDAEIAASRQTVLDRNLTINSLTAMIDTRDAEIARLTALFPKFWGDATRKQFLGAPFLAPFPLCYESEFYPPTVTQANRPNVTIDRSFVLGNTMPKWRAAYPAAPRWISDIEWLNKDGIAAAEVAKVLPGFQAAREFANTEGKGLKLSGYGLPPRIGNQTTDAAVLAQVAIVQPILDLFDECVLPLYAIYTDIEKSRAYIRRNIEFGRTTMPGKPVYVIGWPAWHGNVGAPLAGTPISVEWWHMLMEESRSLADGFAIWLKAAEPKPVSEPWWVETVAFKSSGIVAA